jgi:hypothetical protein
MRCARSDPSLQFFFERMVFVFRRKVNVTHFATSFGNIVEPLPPPIKPIDKDATQACTSLFAGHYSFEFLQNPFRQIIRSSEPHEKFSESLNERSHLAEQL